MWTLSSVASTTRGSWVQLSTVTNQVLRSSGRNGCLVRSECVSETCRCQSFSQIVMPTSGNGGQKLKLPKHGATLRTETNIVLLKSSLSTWSISYGLRIFFLVGSDTSLHKWCLCCTRRPRFLSTFIFSSDVRNFYDTKFSCMKWNNKKRPFTSLLCCIF